MAITRIFRNGNSARHSLDGALARFTQFSDDFMAAGRAPNVEAERDFP